MRYHVRSGCGVIRWAIGITGLLANSALPSVSQINGAAVPTAVMVVSAPDLPRTREEIVREIDDPATGDRWLLERGSGHPGGPGQMVRLGHERSVRASGDSSNEAWGSDLNRTPAPPVPVIHAGDEVILEEHTAVVDATLEAIALGPAREGSELWVRVSMGGGRVRARAIRAGRATLIPESGVRP